MNLYHVFAFVHSRKSARVALKVKVLYRVLSRLCNCLLVITQSVIVPKLSAATYIHYQVASRESVRQATKTATALTLDMCGNDVMRVVDMFVVVCKVMHLALCVYMCNMI